MTMDGKGRIVVIDPFKFRIAAIDAKTGKIAHEGNDPKKRQAFYGDFGQQDGFFANPTGIAYDKSRDWFAVADTSNNRIQILRIPDSGGSLLAPAIGAFRLPMCLFCIPWLLLLAAIIIQVVRRRRQNEEPAEPGRRWRVRRRGESRAGTCVAGRGGAIAAKRPAEGRPSRRPSFARVVRVYVRSGSGRSTSVDATPPSRAPLRRPRCSAEGTSSS